MTPSSFLLFPANSSLLSHLEQLAAISIQTASHDSKAPPSSGKAPFQLPAFSDEDNILLELEEAGICDEGGNPTLSYERLLFTPLSSKNEEDLPTLEAVYHFLHKQRVVQSQVGNEHDLFQIPFSFFELLTHLSHVSQHPSMHQKTYTSFAIDDFELIGRYLIEMLGDYPFIKSCKALFPTIPHQRIHQWFSSSFIQDFFTQQTSDIDLREINQGTIDHQVNLSQNAQNFFTDRMQNFQAETYCQFLKTFNKGKYGSLHPSSYLVRTHSLLEFGGVTKRKIVKNEDNQYTIFGLKTDERPFELISVGRAESSNNQTGLKNTCLSSSNCWTASLIPFLDIEADEVQLSIRTGPFRTVQALIGLLTNSSFILDPSVDTWLRYLRDYSRSLQSEEIEQKMVYQLFKNKISYFQSKFEHSNKIETDTTSSQSIQNITEFSDSHYLACLLEDEIKKNHLTDEAIDPAKAIKILLRACLSIQSTHPLKDEEIALLWQLLEDKELLELQSNSSQSFHLALKQAILDKKIPFSIVSTWIGFLAHTFAPTSLTHHGRKDKERNPVFCLKYPFSMRLPATVQAYDALMLYLNKNGSDGLVQLYRSLEPFFEAQPYPSPIKDCLLHLKGDPKELAKWGDVCLNHSEPFLQFVGAQLYLMAAPYQLNQGQVYRLFYALPSLLETQLPCTQNHFLSQLHQLASACKMPAYQQALNELDLRNLSLFNWMGALMATKDSEMIEMAGFLWKSHPAFEDTSLKKEMGLALLQALSLSLPSKGLMHLSGLIDLNLLNEEEALKEFLGLCKRFQDCKIKLSHAELIDFQTLLKYILANPLTIDELERKTEFTKFALRLISLLYLVPNQQAATDELLLNLSEQSLCHAAPLAETWLTRLEQQCNAPVPPTLAISVRFYELERKGFLKGMDAKSPRLQEFKIKLGMLLLEENSELSKKMLEDLIKSDLEASTLPSLHGFLTTFLTNAFTDSLATENIALLKHLIQITPADKRQQTSKLLQMVCLKASAVSPSEIGPQLEALDALLIASDLFKEASGWRKTLLTYLKQSAIPSSSTRLPAAWMICEQAVNLPGNASDNQLLIQTIAILLAQAEAFNTSPSEAMQSWLKKRYAAVANYLNEQNDSSKASIFLKAVHRLRLVEEQSIFYGHIWKTCQSYLFATNVALPDILSLLQLASFENFRQQLIANDLAPLQILIDRLLIEEELPSTMEAGRWIEACWPLISQEVDLKKNEYNLLLCLNRLVEGQLYREALSSLQTSLPWITSSQDFQNLWVKLIEKLQCQSSLNMLNELFLSQEAQNLFKDSLSPLKELAKKEVGKRLSSPSMAQNLQIILQFLSLYQFKDAKLWFEFSTQLLLSQDKKLIEDSFEAFKSEESCMLHDPLLRASCWANFFKSLYPISPTRLLTYLDALPDLMPLFSHLPANESWEAYRFVFLSAITSLSTKAFNQDLFAKICAVKKEFVAAFKTEKSSTSEIETNLHLWKFDLDCLLIQQLQTLKDSQCLEALCELIQPYLSQLDDKPEVYSRVIGSAEKVIKSYLTLDLPTNHSLHEQIHSLLIQAEHQNTFPAAACSRILIAIKKQHANCLCNSIRLMRKILTHGSIDQKLQLKQPLLTLLPAAASTASRIELIDISQLLESAFKIIKFSSTEKTVLSGHCLNQYLDRQLGKTIPLQELEDVLKFYCDWAPHIFADPKALKETVLKAALIALPFGAVEVADFQDEAQFSLFVKRILNVKYHPHIKRQEAIYQESLKHYVTWCIQAWKKLGVRKDFLVAAFDEFIYQEIIRTSKKEVSLEALLEELDEFIYFGPPEPPHIISPADQNNVQEVIYEQPLQVRSKKLVNFANGIKVLDKRSEKFVEYSIYLNLNSSYETTGKVALQMTSKAVEKLLAYGTGYSIFLSTQAFCELQGLSHVSDSKRLSGYIDQIGKASCKHPLTLINKHTLLYHLYKAIPLSCPPDTLSSEGKTYFSRIYLMQFQKIWSVYQKMEKTASVDYQAYYLKLSLETLHSACLCHGDNRRWEDYIEPLTLMLPAIIRLDAIEVDRENEKLEAPQIGELTDSFLDFLKIAVHASDSTLKLKDKKLISSLFIKWLNALMEIESKKEGRRACRLMCSAFTECLDTPIFHYTQPETVECLNKVLDWMPKYLTYYENPNVEYLRLRFFSHELLNDYPSYLQAVAKLSTKVLSQEVLTKAPGSIGFITYLIARLPNTPVQEVLEMRNSALISFLDLLISALKEFKIDSFSEASNQIVSLLELAIDQQMLTEHNPEAVNVFEVCCEWINPNLEHSFDPDLMLIRLEFYQKSRCSNDYANYYQELRTLMKPLKERIILEQTSAISDRFFKLLSIMPRPNALPPKNLLIAQPGDLLVEWITVLREPFQPLATWQDLRIYTVRLYERASHCPIFKNHLTQILLIINQTQFVNLPKTEQKNLLLN